VREAPPFVIPCTRFARQKLPKTLRQMGGKNRGVWGFSTESAENMIAPSRCQQNFAVSGLTGEASLMFAVLDGFPFTKLPLSYRIWLSESPIPIRQTRPS